MSISQQTKQQAEQLGIALSHYDIDGHLIHAKAESLDYFIQLFQSHSTTDVDYADVIIKPAKLPIQYDLSQFTTLLSMSYHYVLYDEKGDIVTQKANLSTAEITLPALDYGYYDLHLHGQTQQYKVRLFIYPETVYQPPCLSQQKAWGISIQLYSLRSQRNWGIGDFGDLAYLIEQSAQYGVDFIGLNPLHAMYVSTPEWASPYSSSSRRWLNYLYLDVSNIPEFQQSEAVQQWWHSSAIQAELQYLRALDVVDYLAVSQLKLNALEMMFVSFNQLDEQHPRRQQFQQFLQQKGEDLRSHCLFDVLDNLAYRQKQNPVTEQEIGWLGWKKWQHLDRQQYHTLTQLYAGQIQFYAWLQWLTENQLSHIQQLCQQQGMKLGIYGDLAVSSSRGSADVWANQDLYCVDASVGAPPDPLGPVGQNWNLPPYNPTQLKQYGFVPFIEMLRANMRYFGMLRIDHVMGLFRLWLIPPHKTACDGLYVHYPFDVLMAIVAIESQRHQCLVVGEDLGTVPDEVRAKLNEFSLFSYFVLYFAQRHGEYPEASDYPLNAFATIGTHDVPSLTSFWHCDDLQLFEQLKVLQGELLAQKYHQRVQDKQALLNRLHQDQYLPAHYQGDAMTMAMHDHLNQVIHQYLASSQSKLIGVQLENLLGLALSFNLPGVTTEYPSWQKKLSMNIEQIFDSPNIIAFLQLIQQSRQS